MRQEQHSLKAPMLKIGQRIDLLVLMNTMSGSGTSVSTFEVTITFLDLIRE